VRQIQEKKEPIEIAKEFKGTTTTFVVGSCWPEDFSVLAPFINQNKAKLKFIIAPHEIEESFLAEIERSLQVRSIRYSRAERKQESINSYSVLIIDNVGMLSRLYQYGEFAFIGGAFGKGLHNILEAACQGIPVFFGDKNYEKFEEAKELIMRGGAFEVRDYPDLKSKYELMINRPENYLLACEVTRSYVEENIGATSKIAAYCQPFLTQS
jgi:3-deoxy-D-manno-octulosonic-acid transferase